MDCFYTRARLAESDRLDPIVESFPITDSKGRTVGMRCAITRERWVKDPCGQSIMTPQVGVYSWIVNPIPLRDGKPCGTILPRKIRFTLEAAEAEASAAIEAYRAYSAKRHNVRSGDLDPALNIALTNSEIYMLLYAMQLAIENGRLIGKGNLGIPDSADIARSEAIKKKLRAALK